MILDIKKAKTNEIISSSVDFTVNDIWMGIRRISVKVKSVKAISFTTYSDNTNADYVEYEGTRYILFNTPTIKHQNSEVAFEYDLVFSGEEIILFNTLFLDVLKSGLIEREGRYTNGSLVEFQGGASELAQRLQANADTQIGNGIWRFYTDISTELGKMEKYFTFQDANCWDVLKSVNTELLLNFYFDTKSTPKRVTITDKKQEVVPYVFEQGEGRGLYDLTLSGSDDGEIITRIFPLGGDRNIPIDYKKDAKPVDSSRYNPYLMLPNNPDGTIRYYVDSTDGISKYGIRPKSVSDAFGGIFPSIYNTKLSDLYGDVLPEKGNDGVSLVGLKPDMRIDEIVHADTIASETDPFFLIYVTDLGFDLSKKDADGKSPYYTTENAVISMLDGIYGSSNFTIQKDGVVQLPSTDSNYYKGARYSIKVEKDTEFKEPLPSLGTSLRAGDHFVILGINMPKTYINMAENRMLNASTEYLGLYDHAKNKFSFNPSKGFVVSNPDIFLKFKAGNVCQIYDNDMGVPVTDISIESVSIKYSENEPVPSYSATLSEIKTYTTFERINRDISNISSGSSKGTGTGTGSAGGSGGSGIVSVNVNVVPGNAITVEKTSKDKDVVFKVNHGDTSEVKNTDNIDLKVIQNIEVDEFGHIIYIDSSDVAGITDDRYVRKDIDDIVNGVLTFKKKTVHAGGLQLGKQFVSGYVGGIGGYFDAEANGEIESLKIRTSLEVPTITFNNIDVISGDQVSSFSFGTIKDVDTVNRIASLDLLSDERGTPHVNDICRGIFHNIEGNNTGEDGEDENGFMNYSGFATSYFTPTEILENSPGIFRFKYVLKADTSIHPMPGMNFYGYGSFTDKNRQTITYTTRDYTRRLKNMNTWVINPDKNIAMQDGLLEGLTISNMVMHGYGTYNENNYFTGVQIQFTPEQEAEFAGKDAYNVSLSTYESSIIVDDENNILGLTEQRDVYTGQSQVVTGIKDVIATVYKISTRIQAFRGTNELFYSDTYQNNGYIVSLKPVGCIASINGGIITVTDILDPSLCYVEMSVNCEGNVVFDKVFNINVIKNGSSNVSVDIDNEMASVAADDTGKVILGLPVSTNISMWYGLEKIPITNIVLNKPQGVTASYIIGDNSSISVTGITDAAADVLNIGIDVTGIHRNNQYTKHVTFTVNKVKAGENAVLYQLLPSSSAIKKTKAGINVPGTMSCGLIKTTGKEKVSFELSIPTGYSMRYSLDDGIENTYPINSLISVANIQKNITYYLYFGANVVDKETIPIIIDGSDGKDALSNVYADIDNEMDSVAADQNGKVLFGLPLTTNVSMWYGTQELTISKVVLSLPTGVTASYAITKGAKISVTGITDAAADVLNIGITLTATHDSIVYNKSLVFTVNKSKQGENAVLYNLNPSASSVKRNKSNVSVPSFISCSLRRTDGSSNSTAITALPSGYTMKYSLDGGTETAYTIGSSISVTSIVTNITFYLYSGLLVVDRETIPVVVDGTDGINGISNIYADIDNEMTSVATDQNGKVLFGLPLSTNVSMWYGSEEISISKVILSAPSGVTATYSITKGAAISVTAITDAAADVLNIGITITGVYAGVTYNKSLVFTVNKVKAGENAVLYQLLPSVSSIKRSKSNVTTPTSISCSLLKIEGNSKVSAITALPSGYTMKYSLDGGSETSYTITSNISVTSITKNITFYLYSGSVLVDRETIPIVIDGVDGGKGDSGSNGSDGTDSTRYWLVSSVEQIGITSTGTPDPSSFLVYSKKQTGNGSIVANSSYYIILFRGNTKTSLTYVTYSQNSYLSVSPSVSYKYYRICLATSYTTDISSSYIIDSVDVSIVEDGRTGSMPRYTGVFKSGTTYVWDDNYRDIILHIFSGTYYAFQVKNFGAYVTSPPNSYTGDSNWLAADKFNFVAMDTALIDNGKLGGFTFNNNAFQSEDKTSGVSNLILNSKTGYLKCNNAVISGDLQSGSIGGFKISDGNITNIGDKPYSYSRTAIMLTQNYGSGTYIDNWIKIGTIEKTFISMRTDVDSQNGISISLYNNGGTGLYVIANAGSNYAIRSYGDHIFGQRPSESWNAPGVLWSARVIHSSTTMQNVWGNGAGNVSVQWSGNGYCRIYHGLGHTNYIAIANPYYRSGTHNNSYIRVGEINENYFAITCVNADNGSNSDQDFTVAIIGRNIF